MEISREHQQNYSAIDYASTPCYWWILNAGAARGAFTLHESLLRLKIDSEENTILLLLRSELNLTYIPFSTIYVFYLIQY